MCLWCCCSEWHHLRQISGFLQVFWFHPTNKTDRHDITEILLKVVLNTINQAKYYDWSNWSYAEILAPHLDELPNLSKFSNFRFLQWVGPSSSWSYGSWIYNYLCNPVYGEVYSIKHYVIKFVSDFRQVCGFLRVLWFSESNITVFCLNFFSTCIYNLTRLIDIFEDFMKRHIMGCDFLVW
jgi:hypothetical protein